MILTKCLGRCTLEAGKRHVDVRNVIWLGTSNIGHELVFDHHRNRPEPDEQMTREEYLQLMEMLRPRVSDCLGVCPVAAGCVLRLLSILAGITVVSSYHCPSLHTVHSGREESHCCGSGLFVGR